LGLIMGVSADSLSPLAQGIEADKLSAGGHVGEVWAR
jgi:hypothetical protein